MINKGTVLVTEYDKGVKHGWCERRNEQCCFIC